MENVKILVPLDGTERSMHSLNWLKKFFSKDDAEITLMNVVEVVLTTEMVFPEEFYEKLKKESEQILIKAMKELEGYKIDKFTTLGYAGDEILKKAESGKYNIIIMTKSSKKGLSRMVGSVTSKVVKNTQASVIVISE